MPLFENAKRAAMFQIGNPLKSSTNAPDRWFGWPGARAFVIGFTLSLLLRHLGRYCGAIAGSKQLNKARQSDPVRDGVVSPESPKNGFVLISTVPHCTQVWVTSSALRPEVHVAIICPPAEAMPVIPAA
jgi:hypothetical protein